MIKVEFPKRKVKVFKKEIDCQNIHSTTLSTYLLGLCQRMNKYSLNVSYGSKPILGVEDVAVKQSCCFQELMSYSIEWSIVHCSAKP